MFRASSHAPAFILLLFVVAGTHAGGQDREPDKFFRQYADLNDGQIEAIRSGKAVAKVLESRIPDEVFVFGAVYIDAAPESYLKLAGDIAELRKLPGYLAIRKFSDPPQLSDLEGFTVEPGDVKDLKDCKPGDCEFQLPAEAMEEFQRSVNWAAPDAAEQVNRLAQQMALQALKDYIQGGNAALGVYRDKKHPAAVAETFQSLLSRVEALPAYVPDLDRYLLEYPNFKPANAESEFYWEKVNFGLKPTLRMAQRIVYRGAGPAEPAYRGGGETALLQPLFPGGAGLDGLRPLDRPAGRARLLPGDSQRLATGRTDRVQGKLCAQSRGGQDPLLARKNAGDDQAEAGRRQIAIGNQPNRKHESLRRGINAESAPSPLSPELCHAVSMPIKKKVRYQKAALKRSRAETLKATAAKMPTRQTRAFQPSRRGT